MKFCQRHWDKLREAINARGLSSLVADSGETAAKNLLREITDGSPSVDSFDPLMRAHNAILSNAMDTATKASPTGFAELMDDDNVGKGCPICFLQIKHDESCDLPDCVPFESWIDRAADDQVAAWKALGSAGSSPDAEVAE